jgi:hypothetical protein
MSDDGKPKNYLDLLSGECRALSERFRLSGEQSDMLREFVTDTAMKSWRNGRAVGWIRGKNEVQVGSTGGSAAKA